MTTVRHSLMEMAAQRNTVIYAVSYVYEEFSDAVLEISRVLRRMKLKGREGNL